MYVESFKDLFVWQKAIKLVKEIYLFANTLPKSEEYVLKSQMRRAAISIASNIAEGKKRRTRADFIHFLDIADGSAAELETQMILAKELYTKIDCTQSLLLLEEVQKMLAVMIRKLEPSKS